jgi:signal transduction histidine kinase
MVETYGATIRIESAGAGQGTTVTLRWPFQAGKGYTAKSG